MNNAVPVLADLYVLQQIMVQVAVNVLRAQQNPASTFMKSRKKTYSGQYVGLSARVGNC